MDIQATPPHPEIAVEEEIREIPNIANAPLDRNPYSKDSGYQKYETAANKDPHPSCTADKIEGGELATEGGEGGVKPTPLDAEAVEMREEHLRPETAQGGNYKYNRTRGRGDDRPAGTYEPKPSCKKHSCKIKGE